MLKFLIILAAWMTPGIVLFLYLLWIIKRPKGQRTQLELPLTERPVSGTSENNPGLRGAHGAGTGQGWIPPG